VYKVLAAKECNNTPQEFRQQWTIQDNGKDEKRKNNLHIIWVVTQPVLL
jgi:hypothetical protein